MKGLAGIYRAEAADVLSTSSGASRGRRAAAVLVRWRCVVVLCLVLGGCSDVRQRALQRMEKTGAERLRRDAAYVYKENLSGHETDFIIIRPKYWPESFRQLHPLRVGVYRDGISLAFAMRSASEAGLYVVPASMEQAPVSTPGARFEPLSPGIYWYSFGD